MLSPASLRVCCLAVMAPALTKADRQADCLPVVLSESFCVSDTTDTFSGENRLSEIRQKCAVSPLLHTKRKTTFMKSCSRYAKSGLGLSFNKHKCTVYSKKSLLYASIRPNSNSKCRKWPSTKAITAYADKIKLKYTMNKHTTNAKKMGLAKANTSIGLHDLKMKHYAKENLETVSNTTEIGSQLTDTVQQLISDVVATSNDVCDEASVANETHIHSEISEEVEPITSVSMPVIKSYPDSHETGIANLEEDAGNKSVTLTDIPLQQKDCSNSNDSNVSTTCFSSSDVLQDSTIPTTSSCERLPDIEVCNETSDIRTDISNLSLPSTKYANFDFSRFTDVKMPFLTSKYSGSSLMASSIFSTITSAKLLSNAKKLSHISEKPVPVLPDTRFGLQYFMSARKDKPLCCLPSPEELDSLGESLEDNTKMKSLCLSTCLLLQKCVYIHAKTQLEKFVEYYQRKFKITCQHKTVSSKPGKDSEIKAELLQSDDVKSLSTAALVSLVRKLESGSQTSLFPPKAPVSVETDCSENTEVAFSTEELVDIKRTTRRWLQTLQDLKKEVDPDCTESSAEEYEDDVDKDSLNNKHAFSKFLRKRAAICSRASWLISRYHEVDYRLKELNERWADIWRAQGNVPFKNPECSESHISRSDLLSTKETMKNCIPPLNGCLDHTALSQLGKSTFGDLFNASFEQTGEITETDEEMESSSRTQPLDVTNFRKRKLVFISGVQEMDSKFSRLSTVSCSCNSQKELAPCILCAEHNTLQSIDPDSMSIRERVAILDPYFHPVLSTEEEIPIHLHWENILKGSSKYQNIRPVSPQNIDGHMFQEEKPMSSGFRSRRRLSRYARSLSAKYRDKQKQSKHLRKHKLIFGNWRRLQSKNAMHNRKRIRKYSVASSDASSPESPEHSPVSEFDDGFGYESFKRRRDDGQFDIDDVILPCNSRSGRLVEIQYKEIMIPKWRYADEEFPSSEIQDDNDIEVISDAYLTKRHDLLEVEEKERMKRSPLGLSRRSRRNRCDSRAESSGANTPDTGFMFNQDSMFQPADSATVYGPASPLSPATPNSLAISDDSQTASGSGISTRAEKKKVSLKPPDENSNACELDEIDVVLPFEPLSFPLDDAVLEELLNESDHNNVVDLPSNLPSFPASPLSSTSSTSTVEEDEDLSDPEWTVVKPKGNGLDQTLVLKFAKR